MKIDKLTFVLENCDEITISGEYIGDFLVDNIQTSFQRIACNAIDKMDVAQTFAVEIHKDANVKYNQFGVENLAIAVFSRLSEDADITSIEFDLVQQDTEQDDNACEPRTEHYKYFVEWIDGCKSNNKGQKSYISKCGNLYLVINEDKNIEDFFDMELIDDEEGMNIVFDMYGVGDKKQK